MWFFTSPRNPYRETVEAKRSRRADAIEHAPVFAAEKHQMYLDSTGIDSSLFLFILAALGNVHRLIDFWGRAASQIVENILAGTWTASEVLEAYIARAAQAHQVMNCLTEGTCEVGRSDDNVDTRLLARSHVTNSVLRRGQAGCS